MKPLTQSTVEIASTKGWTIGIVIGTLIVVVVVILVGLILYYAARIGAQVKDGIGAMETTHANTSPVWALQEINISTTGIWRAAEAARILLTGGRR